MTNYKVLLAGLLCLNMAAINTALADGYTTQSTESTSYSTQTANNTPPAIQHHAHRRHHQHEDQSLSISINVADPAPQYIQRETTHSIVMPNPGRHHRAQEMAWVTASQHSRLPRYLVTGGYQSHPPATLYVCRGFYQGGVHPGKLYNGNCNFGWGGNEIVVLSDYEVLTSRRALSWVPASYGRIPSGAIAGGHQHDGQLFICQARYRGGMHPGKLYRDACLIGWGGKEIAIPEYYVLTG